MSESSEAPHVLAKLRVIYGDTDQMGVVYYANYFRYFEFSRSEYLRARGGNYTDFEKAGFGLPVVSAHCDYRRPAKYDDLILIDVHLAELRRASLRFEYEVRREIGNEVLATGYTLHACIGPAGKPTGLPESLLKVLRNA
jgi:acyl-CoA thioester hydrolase